MGPSRYSRDCIHRERKPSRRPGCERSRGSLDHRLSAVALTLVVVLLSGGCRNAGFTEAGPPPSQPEVDFTTIDSPSLQFLPRHEEAEGWRLDEDPVVVPGERAAAYLGAVAVELQPYELIDVTAGKYTQQGAEGFATVEIFRFPDFVKSFGAYSARKETARSYVQIENEGYVSKYALHVWRGPFYFRVTGGATNALESLARLASSVAERMPPAPGKPAVFSFFPTDSRVANSERYSAEQGLGQALLGNSFQADFNAGDEIVHGLIIPAANKAAATRILDAYRETYVRNGKLLDPINNLGEDNFTAEDRYMGRAVAFRLDRFVIAFNGYRDRQALIDLAAATDARILGSIRRQLVSAEQPPKRPAATSTTAPWNQPQPPAQPQR